MISEKGRISLPSKLRQETGDKLVIARWYEKCLVMVSQDSWAKFRERVSGENLVVTRPIRGLERFLLSSSYEVETDGQGRFIVPQVLREFASLKEKIVILGLGDRIEIWDQFIWSKEELEVRTESEKFLEEVIKQNKHVGGN